MADFPASLEIFAGTKEEVTDQRLMTLSRSGKPHIRVLQTAKRRSWTLALKNMSDADRSTFWTFYDANRATTFNFTWKGVTYTVAFTDSKLVMTPEEDSYQSMQVSIIDMS